MAVIATVLVGFKSGKKTVSKTVSKDDELVKEHQEKKRIYLDEATPQQLGKAMGKKGGRPRKQKVIEDATD